MSATRDIEAEIDRLWVAVKYITEILEKMEKRA